MRQMRRAPCEACHGTGRRWRHVPSFLDPYYEHETREPCPECAGTGTTEHEAEPVDEDDVWSADQDPVDAVNKGTL